MADYIVHRDSDYLEHHGILGQKWGVRRFQNPDGTLTQAGKERYRGEIGEQDRKNLDTVRNKFRRSYAAQASKNENGLLSYDQVRKAEKSLSGESGESIRSLANSKMFDFDDYYDEIDWKNKKRMAERPLAGRKALQAFYDALYDAVNKRDQMKAEFVNEALQKLDNVKKKDRELAEAYVHYIFKDMEEWMDEVSSNAGELNKFTVRSIADALK